MKPIPSYYALDFYSDPIGIYLDEESFNLLMEARQSMRETVELTLSGEYGTQAMSLEEKHLHLVQ